jgi:hypothetical protein
MRRLAGRLVCYLRRRLPGRSVQRLDIDVTKRIQPPIVDTVKAWCETQTGYCCQVIHGPEVTRRRPPHTIEPTLDEHYFGIVGDWDRREYTVPERYLAQIPRARLIGETGLVVMPDGAFTKETAFSEQILVGLPAYFTPLPRAARRKRGNYFSLLSMWTHLPNYYHWIHDAILGCYLVLPYLPDDVRFIVPAQLQDTKLDSLALLGITPDRLCRFPGDQLWELETLYFAPPSAYSVDNSPAAVRWLRDLAWSEYGVPSTSTRRRIYISRRNAQYRRIINESEIEEVLHSYGFETFLFEELSFREQVALMAQAEAVVSLNGAGLINLIFAPPQTKVLLMVEPKQLGAMFWTLTEAAGQEFWYTMGEAVPGNSTSVDADLRIAPSKVARSLDAMFA